MLKPLDDHWVRHLTALDMLREGIGLRAIAQQNPLVAYQKEAYEMYQEMMDSVQRAIIHSLFVAPRPAQPQQRQARRPAGPPLVSAAQRQGLRATGGSEQAAPPPQTTRRPGMRELGRNDPCWCGSGKKYKTCHLRQDEQAGQTRYVSEQGGGKK